MHASYDGRACDSMKRKLPIGGASIATPRESEATLKGVLIELGAGDAFDDSAVHELWFEIGRIYGMEQLSAARDGRLFGRAHAAVLKSSPRRYPLPPQANREGNGRRQTRPSEIAPADLILLAHLLPSQSWESGKRSRSMFVHRF
jgi:hypothetical protein